MAVHFTPQSSLGFTAAHSEASWDSNHPLLDCDAPGSSSYHSESALSMMFLAYSKGGAAPRVS